MSWDMSSEERLKVHEELLRLKREGKLYAEHRGEISIYSVNPPPAAGEERKMPMTESFIAEAIELEQQFAANNGQGSTSNPTYLFYPDYPSLRVLITAPHAVVHWRDGTEWDNQVYTGPLAMQLAKKNQGNAFILAKSIKGEAPNYYPNSPFRKRLLDLFTTGREPPPYQSNSQYYGPLIVAFDLHGIPASWKWDMYIGTGHGTTLCNTPFLDILISRLRQHGIMSLGIDAPGWSASSSVTIAQTLSQQVKIPTLQLAISHTFRDPINRPTEYEGLFTALNEAISEMEPFRQ